MDIELLSGFLKALLLDKDEVGMPGLGTFVCEIVPASFSDRGYTINPPYRRVSFSQAPSQDNSLVEAYAAAASIDERAALNTVRKFLSDLAAQLRREKSVTLPGLGRLRATKDNSFFFVSDADLDIFPDGFALAPVSMRQRIGVPSLAELLSDDAAPAAGREEAATAEETKETAPAEEPGETALQSELDDAAIRAKVRRRRKRALWWIIPLVLVLLAAIFYLAFMLLAMYRPDLLDLILYTPEELEIINYVL